tara:strand:- start:356 stop:643 length:288 start_codon:yes stop_codon:yes gene_type:complete
MPPGNTGLLARFAYPSGQDGVTEKTFRFLRLAGIYVGLSRETRRVYEEDRPDRTKKGDKFLRPRIIELIPGETYDLEASAFETPCEARAYVSSAS